MQVDGLCTLYIPRKSRFCKFPVWEDSKFCTFHRTDDSRIVCPLDPLHSIDKSDLALHLTKCPSRPQPPPPWFQENCNLNNHNALEPLELSSVPRNVLDDVIAAAKRIASTELETDVRTHPSMNERIQQGMKLKHAKQQASLLGHLNEMNLLNDTPRTFIEWGAGRAEFSKFIHLAIPSRQHTFLLIDKSPVRNKEDHRIKEDVACVRVKGDIKDIQLPRLAEGRITSISKHLCGAATDLTIQCLHHYDRTLQDGLVIALCCHHRCRYDALHPLSLAFLEGYGIRADKFNVLSRLGTWFVQGDRDVESDHWSGIPHAERERIGWLAKRAIDLARVHALRELGWTVRLVKYVDESVTKECVAIIAYIQ